MVGLHSGYMSVDKWLEHEKQITECYVEMFQYRGPLRAGLHLENVCRSDIAAPSLLLP